MLRRHSTSPRRSHPGFTPDSPTRPCFCRTRRLRVSQPPRQAVSEPPKPQPASLQLVLVCCYRSRWPSDSLHALVCRFSSTTLSFAVAMPPQLAYTMAASAHLSHRHLAQSRWPPLHRIRVTTPCLTRRLPHLAHTHRPPHHGRLGLDRLSHNLASAPRPLLSPVHLAPPPGLLRAVRT